MAEDNNMGSKSYPLVPNTEDTVIIVVPPDANKAEIRSMSSSSEGKHSKNCLETYIAGHQKWNQ